MRWGAPQHSARLYRNLRDHAPHAFGFEDVVIHEEDAMGDFDCQPSCTRRTAVGTFYPLSAFMAALYERGRASRHIFTVLVELDRLLPAERPVTARDIVNFCQSLGEAKPLPPERQADPPTDLLATMGGGGKRDAHSFEYYNRETGIAVFTSPSVKPGAFFQYFDPLRTLEEAQQRRWQVAGESRQMIDEALEAAKATVALSAEANSQFHSGAARPW
jgi:hypothetical protein